MFFRSPLRRVWTLHLHPTFKQRKLYFKTSPFKSWEYWRTCWTNNSFYSCVNTVQLGVRTSRIFISGWILGGDSGLASALDFCLVNTISNAWYPLYDPLHAIALCYCPWLVPVSETSSHDWCRYLMLKKIASCRCRKPHISKSNQRIVYAVLIPPTTGTKLSIGVLVTTQNTKEKISLTRTYNNIGGCANDNEDNVTCNHNLINVLITNDNDTTPLASLAYIYQIF